jgi:hypothetical protein
MKAATLAFASSGVRPAAANAFALRAGSIAGSAVKCLD